MKRSYRMFVEDILSSMDKIGSYTEGLTYRTFIKNGMVTDAVLRNLEIIGEASGNIPERVRKMYPKIPWRRMVGLRNIAIHEYFGVDFGIVWEIVSKDLPKTRIKIAEMLRGFNE